jgi:hypothetical protein
MTSLSVLLTTPKMSRFPEVKSVWFLPKTRDPLNISAIRLGTVIESPWSPDEALNEDDPPATKVRRQEETSWSWKREFERSAGGGLLASFLQLFGLGGDIGSTVDKAHTDIYAAERMITDEFIPDRKYLEQCFQDLGVRDVFVGPGRKSKAYMVTGLKTAYGATKATEMMKRKSVHARAGVDASASGLPLSLGLDGHRTSSFAETSTADKSDFVFGFRLRRLRYKKGELSHESFDKGAQFGIGRTSDMDDDDVEKLDAEDFEIEDMVGSSLEEFRMKSSEILMRSGAGEEMVQVYSPISP